MATKPVQNALAAVSFGEQGGLAITGADGTATMTIRINKTGYEAVTQATAAAEKDGYQGNRVIATSFPTWAEALAAPIDLPSVMLEKLASRRFYITPETGYFTPSGGTRTFTVTCPDNTWEVAEYDSRLVVAKTGEATLTVTASAEAAAAASTFEVFVKWYDSENEAWLRRGVVLQTIDAENQSAITFTGRITNASTGAGIKAYLSAQDIYSEDKGLMSGYAAAENGTFSLTRYYSQPEWEALRAISISVYQSGYLNNEFHLLPAQLGGFTSAVGLGVSIGDIPLTPEGDTFKTLQLTGYVFGPDGNPLIGSNTPQVTVLTSDGETVVGSARADSTGRYIIERAYNYEQYAALRLRQVVANGAAASSSGPLSGIAAVTLPAWDAAELSATIQIITLARS